MSQHEAQTAHDNSLSSWAAEVKAEPTPDHILSCWDAEVKGKPRTDVIEFCAAEVKAEPKTASKRRSPVQPSLQPTAKRGRLLRQRSPSTSTEADSDATMEECVSPSRQGRGKKDALESDDDEDYVPG